MKRWIALLLIIITSFSIPGCKKNEYAGVEVQSYEYTEEGDFAKVVLGEVMLQIELGSLEEEAMNYVAMKVEEASAAADAFLGSYVSENSIICYVHGGDGATSVYGNEIHIYYPKNLNVPYIQLLTQVKAGVVAVPDWLQIGLGAYAADVNGECLLDTYARTIDVFASLPRINENEEAIEYSNHDLTKILMDQDRFSEALALSDLTDAVVGFSEAQEAYDFRGAYYVCAGSFVQYLDEQYGRDALMKLYVGATMEEVTGYSRDEMLQAWKQSLQYM